MNKARRKELAKAVELIERAREIIEVVKDEEQDAFDNLPESLQASERGERMEEFISALEDFLDEVDTDDLVEIIDG